MLVGGHRAAQAGLHPITQIERDAAAPQRLADRLRRSIDGVRRRARSIHDKRRRTADAQLHRFGLHTFPGKAAIQKCAPPAEVRLRATAHSAGHAAPLTSTSSCVSRRTSALASTSRGVLPQL